MIHAKKKHKSCFSSSDLIDSETPNFSAVQILKVLFF